MYSHSYLPQIEEYTDFEFWATCDTNYVGRVETYY
jgi:hypothetical protein